MRNFEVSARNTAAQIPAASDTLQPQPCIFEAPQKCIQHSRDTNTPHCGVHNGGPATGSS